MAESILDDIFAGADGVSKTLISLLGADATIYLPLDATYNPLTDATTGGGLDAGTAVDIASLEDVSERDINGTTIILGDYKCLVPASDVTLLRAHIQKAMLDFNGVQYKLTEYKPVYSGQQIAQYSAFWRNL